MGEEDGTPRGFPAGAVPALRAPSRSPTVTEAPVEDERFMQRAIELALEQPAEVLVVRHHDDLRGHGSIGAILRF